MGGGLTSYNGIRWSPTIPVPKSLLASACPSTLSACIFSALLFIAAGAFALYNSWRAHQLGTKTQESVNRIMKDLGEGSSDDVK
jgi:hypothetical protein